MTTAQPSLNNKKENRGKLLNNAAFWLYAAAVSFTALGPVIHYALIPLSLIFLAAGAVTDKSLSLPRLTESTRKIIFLLVLFIAWAIFPNIINTKNAYEWGKGASTFAEALIYLFMGIVLFNTEKRRAAFASLFVAVNTLFALEVMVRQLPQLQKYHFLIINASLNNGNVIGVYALLILPLLSCWALWVSRSQLLKLVVPLTAAALLTASFSSGAWFAGLIMLVIFLIYSVKCRTCSVKILLLLPVLLLLSGLVFNSLSGGAVKERFLMETQQAEQYHDAQKFTNKRLGTWQATMYMIKQHPIVGHGRESFKENFQLQLTAIKKAIRIEELEVYQDPHSLFFYAAYAAGIPGLVLLVLFLAALLFYAAVRSWRETPGLPPGTVPWALVAFMLIAGQAVQGLSGDIFDARRDIGVIFWALTGLFLGLPACVKKHEAGTFRKAQ